MSNRVCSVFVKFTLLSLVVVTGAGGCGGGDKNCAAGPDGWCWWTYAEPSTTATWVTPPSAASAHALLTAETASVDVSDAGVGFSFGPAKRPVDLTSFDRILFTATASFGFQLGISTNDTAGCSMNFTGGGTKQTYTAEFALCRPFLTDPSKPGFSLASVEATNWGTLWGTASSLDIEIVPDILFCLGTQCTANPLSP
jgi:hypothetical protein